MSTLWSVDTAVSDAQGFRDEILLSDLDAHMAE